MASDWQAGAVIGVDVGSASVRAGAFGPDGTRLAFAFRPIQLFRDGADLVEQSSADIWSQACAAVQEVLEKAELLPVSVRGIGFGLAPVSSRHASRDRHGFLPGRVELRAHVLSMAVIVHIDELVRDRFGDGLVAVQCAHLAENGSYVHVDRDFGDANRSSDFL